MGMEHADVSSMDTKESSLTIFDSTWTLPSNLGKKGSSINRDGEKFKQHFHVD